MVFFAGFKGVFGEGDVVGEDGFSVEGNFVVSLAIIFAHSENGEVVFSAGVGKGEGCLSGFVFFGINGEPFALVEVEASIGGDVRSVDF